MLHGIGPRAARALLSPARPPPLLARPLWSDREEARRSGRRLRLWVDDRLSPVGGWPWEYLWWEQRGGFFVLDPVCFLVRSCRRPAGEGEPVGAVPAGPDLRV